MRSTINGVVTDVHRDEGEFVSAADPTIATLVDLSQLRVSFYLSTRLAASFAPRNQVTVRFIDRPDTAPATVEYVGPLTQADSGRVRVDVLIDNSAGKYRSGLRCVLETPKRRLAVQPAAGHSWTTTPLLQPR